MWRAVGAGPPQVLSSQPEDRLPGGIDQGSYLYQASFGLILMKCMLFSTCLASLLVDTHITAKIVL